MTQKPSEQTPDSGARRLARRLIGSGFLDPVEVVQEVPDRFGRYEVLRPLGRGASSEVYLAHDPAVGREVAIKVLLRVDADPARFKREARTREGRWSAPETIHATVSRISGWLPWRRSAGS